MPPSRITLALVSPLAVTLRMPGWLVKNSMIAAGFFDGWCNGLVDPSRYHPKSLLFQRAIQSGNVLSVPRSLRRQDGISTLHSVRIRTHVGGSAARNWSSYGHDVRLPDDLAPWQQALLCDPQTSGGLLVTCAPPAVTEVLSLFRDAGFASAAVIGQMQAGAARITVDYRLDLPTEAPAAQVAEVPD